MTTALEEGEGSASRPGRSLPPGKSRYPLYRRLGGSQGRSGQVRKISPPPGFDSRTVQPVASRYTDCATRPTKKGCGGCLKYLLSWGGGHHYMKTENHYIHLNVQLKFGIKTSSYVSLQQFYIFYSNQHFMCVYS